MGIGLALLAALQAAPALSQAPEPTEPPPPTEAPPATTDESPAPASETVAPAHAAEPAPPSSPSPAPVRATEAAPREAAPARSSAPEGPAIPPSDLNDLSAWLSYKSRHHIASLPIEARIFHRRGILLRESGQGAEAARMVRGASELDPGYLAPHLTLAEWSLLVEPSQALLRYATVLDLARQNFMLQLALVANFLYTCLQALFLGLLATAVLLLVTRQEQLRHLYAEALGRFVGRRSANLWSWGLLVLPFMVGFGFTLPALLLLGLLWPLLRPRERFVVILFAAAVAAMPFASRALDRLTLPLDESRPPLYGVALAETEPLSMERSTQLAALAQEHSDNPFLQFAAGWAARRTGRIAAAESYFERSRKLWPDDDRTLNNLGCVKLMRGHDDEALQLFEEATRLQPDNAAAWFNLAQIHTQRFDYRSATDALSRASALDFDLVKTTQSQIRDDGALPLVEQWIAPTRLWKAVTRGQASAGTGALPPIWRHTLETRGWPFSVAAIVLVALGITIGLRAHKGLPLRACSNCQRVVCRRCSERRREHALCTSCVESEKRAESADFSRLLLVRLRRRRDRVQHLVRTALATLIPGLGLLLLNRVFSPLLLLVASAGLLAPWLVPLQPFAFEPRLALAPTGLPWQLQAGGWILIYAWSLLGYFRVLARRSAEASRQAAPVRSRAGQATARETLSDAA